MKNCVFWDVCSVRRLLVTASLFPSPPILVTLMKEALSSSERRFLQEPHGVTSQKTPYTVVTAVKTSNLTNINYIIFVDERILLSNNLSICELIVNKI
jgi:hypothetical protein